MPLSVYGQDPTPRPDNPARKAWEWCAIAQALYEREMLEGARSGLGFAVGREPLPSLFASMGVQVVATDLAPSQGDGSWAASEQHSNSLDEIFRPEIVSREQFQSNVQFRYADMRDLSDLDGEFDFIWSSCSLEHLGGLQHGIEFVEESMRLVKSGGVAVHTTEFNVSSNDTTTETGGAVIYRQRDIEQLDRELRLIDCGLAEPDYYCGDHRYDLLYDTPPWGRPERRHVKLMLDGYVATSMLLIVRKA